MINFLNLLNKKEKNNEKLSLVSNWQATIKFKDNDEVLYFTNFSDEEFPETFKDLLDWFYKYKTKMYMLNYKNGTIVLDRDTLLYIWFNKI